jgi:hypothetical protein
MKCSLLTLSCALDGELSRERQSELEAHIVTCERCRTGMRYLREETERISQLIRVEIPAGTATALLERAKVVTSTLPPSVGDGPQPPAKPTAVHEQVADPFNLMGIGTPVIETAEEAAEVAPPPRASDELFPTAPDELTGEEPALPEAPRVATDEGPKTLDAIENPEPPLDRVIPITGTRQNEPEASSEAPSLAPATGKEDEVEGAAAAGPEPWPEPLAEPALDKPAAEAAAGAVLEAGALAPESELESPFGRSAPADFYSPTLEGDLGFSNPFEVTPGDVGDRAFPNEGPQHLASPEGIVDHSNETPIELPPLPLVGPPAMTPPPPSIVEPASSGWQPNGDLNLAPGDIAAAEPEFDALGIDVIARRSGGATPPSSAVPSARSSFSPLRPADAVVSDRLTGQPRSPLGRAGTPVRRRPAEAPGGRGGRSQPLTQKTGAPRSWTRTATIAIAAVAVVLIGWSLLHHSTSPAPSHTHKTVPAKVKATPTAPATAKATATPSVTLTGTQSFGGIGTGYQVQNAIYGLHDNNAQLWVVFQLVSGNGAPKITTGFDGARTLYVEMAGTAPGPAVAQPVSGLLVTSITVGHVSGFSGAVYVLQLSKAATVSGSLLPGSPSGSSGERVVLILQQ